MNNDSVTITAIHTDTLQVDLSLTIGGVTYVDTLPILDLTDVTTLTAQLQAFSQETRSEFQAIVAAQQAKDESAAPVVDPSVIALVGTAIPVDPVVTTAPVEPAPSTVPTPETVPSDTTVDTTTAPADTSVSTDATATDGTTPTEAPVA